MYTHNYLYIYICISICITIYIYIYILGITILQYQRKISLGQAFNPGLWKATCRRPGVARLDGTFPSWLWGPKIGDSKIDMVSIWIIYMVDIWKIYG